MRNFLIFFSGGCVLPLFFERFGDAGSLLVLLFADLQKGKEGKVSEAGIRSGGGPIIGENRQTAGDSLGRPNRFVCCVSWVILVGIPGGVGLIRVGMWGERFGTWSLCHQWFCWDLV